MSPEDSLPDFLKPYLRIFLSIDIVGSTQFKQSVAQVIRAQKADGKDDDIQEPWLNAILEFYHQVSSIFFQTWKDNSNRAEKYGWQSGPPPRLWKAVGDELIFTKRLTDHRQAYVCIASLISTAKNCRKKLKKHSNNIDLKCTAWIAGFPVNNKEVSLITDLDKISDVGDYIYENMNRLDSSESKTLDYVGPSIDTGFRLGAFSSARKCIISVDLAYILSHISGNLPSVDPQLKHFIYHYEGKHVLKGVNNGSPYPIFWIDASEDGDKLIELEDRLEKREEVPHSQVKSFCEHFLDKNKDTHIMPPYIITDESKIFSDIPLRHKKRINVLLLYYVKEKERLNTEKNALSEEDSQNSNALKNEESEAKLLQERAGDLINRSDNSTITA